MDSAALEAYAETVTGVNVVLTTVARPVLTQLLGGHNINFDLVRGPVALAGRQLALADAADLLERRRKRQLRPDLTIGFFLHIPFPSADLFLQLPWSVRGRAWMISSWFFTAW